MNQRAERKREMSRAWHKENPTKKATCLKENPDYHLIFSEFSICRQQGKEGWSEWWGTSSPLRCPQCALGFCALEFSFGTHFVHVFLFFWVGTFGTYLLNLYLEFLDPRLVLETHETPKLRCVTTVCRTLRVLPIMRTEQGWQALSGQRLRPAGMVTSTESVRAETLFLWYVCVRAETLFQLGGLATTSGYKCLRLPLKAYGVREESWLDTVPELPYWHWPCKNKRVWITPF